MKLANGSRYLFFLFLFFFLWPGEDSDYPGGMGWRRKGDTEGGGRGGL